jgi:hypothetical protein
MGVVLAVAVGLGAAAAAGDTWCQLAPQGFAFVAIDVTAQGHVTSKWTQPLQCSSGVSLPPGCWTCLWTELYRWDPATQTWPVIDGGPAIDSIACNRTGTKVRSNDWGIQQPGIYFLRAFTYQGGKCSQFKAWFDTKFQVSAPTTFGG